VFLDHKGVLKHEEGEETGRKVEKILNEFNAAHYVDGIIEIVKDIGEALVKHFPYEQEDKNELPDNIVFGS
jgi:uncharacterized membrane protein